MSTGETAFEIQSRQTYTPCREGGGRRFVVVKVHGDRAEVWDPFGGPRGLGSSRWVAVRNLHTSGTTQHGRQRRTGYRLLSQPTGEWQELCGSCMRWHDEDDMATIAHGYGHSTCKPCMADIEKRYGGARTTTEGSA